LLRCRKGKGVAGERRDFDVSEIERAVEILRAGGLVGFPTETVYGLGADATNAKAIKRIFEAKGRPSTNPLICHVADAEVARKYAREWPEVAQRLADAFWPGPLTLVLEKNPIIVNDVTAGLSTVGLRAPDHALTLVLLRQFNGAIAGPSANRSNHVSPTTAAHVREELGDRVDLILDGGPCRVGIESTVLDLTQRVPRILRPGGVSKEQIEAVIGAVEIKSATLDATEAAMSPGQMARHYSPRKPAYRFEREDRERVLQQFEADPTARFSVLLIDATVRGVMFRADEERLGPGWKFTLPADAAAYARNLYATLRLMDEGDADAIYVEMPPDEPEWAAVRDRLVRATKSL
jgi:L-threonylcarbamoyladenylate synthase